MNVVRMILGIAAAVMLHAGFILFGGLLFNSGNKDHSTMQEVELISDNDLTEKAPEIPPQEIAKPELTEDPPDAAEIIRSLETSPVMETPELEAASLSAIEAALSGQGGAAGDFSDSLNFASGGRIGGTGKAGALDERLEAAFSLSEIDQKPRPIFQAAPTYPSALRSQKLEGIVSIIFVVDATGRVTNLRVEKSNHAAFEQPALEAVKKWKFEAAVKGGQRVACKMRAPIRFQPS